MGTGWRALREGLASWPEQRHLRARLPSPSSPLSRPRLSPVLPQSQQLQQQVAQLHEALRSQESRWAAAQRHLQSQIDALVQQNLELRDELTAPRPLWEADAALGARLKLDTLVWKACSFYVEVTSQ